MHSCRVEASGGWELPAHPDRHLPGLQSLLWSPEGNLALPAAVMRPCHAHLRAAATPVPLAPSSPILSPLAPGARLGQASGCQQRTLTTPRVGPGSPSYARGPPTMAQKPLAGGARAISPAQGRKPDGPVMGPTWGMHPCLCPAPAAVRWYHGWGWPCPAQAVQTAGGCWGGRHSTAPGELQLHSVPTSSVMPGPALLSFAGSFSPFPWESPPHSIFPPKVPKSALGWPHTPCSPQPHSPVQDPGLTSVEPHHFPLLLPLCPLPQW